MEAIRAKPTKPDLPKLLREGKSDDEIRTILIAQYDDSPVVVQLMQEVKKLRSAKATSAGLIFILAGAVVLLASFLMAYLRFSTSDSLSFALYGLTTAGILIVFVGLMKIFG